MKRQIRNLLALLLSTLATVAHAWDHPGHMTSAAIAFADIQEARPELIEKLGLLFLAHPDPAPFWVAAGEARAASEPGECFSNAPAGRMIQNSPTMTG